jgi:mannose-1-phosphate guanylyltransferase
MIKPQYDDSLYAIVMAGGSGTRFWPRSRETRPKQLLNITGDTILLRKAIQVIMPIVPASRIKVITTESQAEAVKTALPEISANNVISEPCARNTAPAIGMSALFLEQDNPDAIMVILPADHFIEDEDRFRQLILAGAGHAARSDVVVTIGIMPRGPETGYGYIEADEVIDEEAGVYPVRSFHEKPDMQTARGYVARSNFFWNTGIFIARASHMLREIQNHMPHHYRRLMDIKSCLGTDKQAAVIRESYRAMDAISIDYGVMEKTENVLMVKGDFGWDDVGSWVSAAKHWPMDSHHNASVGELISLDAMHCIVYSPKKLVALLGVEGLVIVEEDDVLLVCKKERSQDVKQLVEILRSQGRDDVL